MFDAISFAGGGNRCYWQGGFHEAASERLDLTAPRMVASYESLYRELAPPPRGSAWRRAAARI